MRSFSDNMHQQWNLSLTLGKVRNLRDKLGLDLLNPQHHLQVLNSLTDRMAFVFLLCESQAKEYEVDVDEFEERLMGDGFADDASVAFLEELSDFFQRLGQVGLAKITQRSIKTMKAGKERMTQMIANGHFDSLLDTVEKEMEQLLPENAGSGSQS